MMVTKRFVCDRTDKLSYVQYVTEALVAETV